MRVKYLMRVSDLSRSLAFYVGMLGYTQHLDQPENGVAIVEPQAGWAVLLAGPEAGDLSEWLEPVHSVAEPGKRIYNGGGTPAYRDVLVARGVTVNWKETEWGYSTLEVTDPDGYVAYFGNMPPWTDAEMLDWYRQAPDRLEAAVAGLTGDQLDLCRAHGKWSIRQLVLHIADSDCTSLARPKFALAEPGRLYTGNPYNPDAWADGLDYAHRPIAAEVALFRAIRAHMESLMTHLPGALDRSTKTPEGQQVPIRSHMQALTVHALHHIEQIRETRAVHKL